MSSKFPVCSILCVSKLLPVYDGGGSRRSSKLAKSLLASSSLGVEARRGAGVALIELSKGDVTEQFTSKESSSRLHVAGAAG